MFITVCGTQAQAHGSIYDSCGFDFISLEETNIEYFNFFCSGNKTSRGEKWRTKCLNSRFPLITLLQRKVENKYRLLYNRLKLCYNNWKKANGEKITTACLSCLIE